MIKKIRQIIDQLHLKQNQYLVVSPLDKIRKDTYLTLVMHIHIKHVTKHPMWKYLGEALSFPSTRGRPQYLHTINI